MAHPAGPAHLGNVDHALDAVLDLHERAVVRHGHHPAGDNRADGIAFCGGLPRVVGLLFEPEADTLGLRVEAEDHDLDLLANADHLARVLDAAPAHVGHVEQAVDAAHVHESAEVGDVLDFPGEQLSDVDGAQQRLFLFRTLFFEQLAAAHHDIAAALGELDDFELHALADIPLEVAGGTEGQLAGRHERVDADIHLEPALHAACDGAFDGAIGLVDVLDVLPVLDAIGFLLRENGHAVLVFRFLDVEIEGVAHGNFIHRAEFVGAHDALALVADVDKHAVIADIDNASAHDFALFEVAHGLVVEGLEVLHRHRLRFIQLEVVLLVEVLASVGCNGCRGLDARRGVRSRLVALIFHFLCHAREVSFQ